MEAVRSSKGLLSFVVLGLELGDGQRCNVGLKGLGDVSGRGGIEAGRLVIGRETEGADVRFDATWVR